MNMGIRTKIVLMAALPVVVTALLLAVFFYSQINSLGHKEIASYKEKIMQAKKEELKNYMDLAFSSIEGIYENAGADDENAKNKR